ncbi:MAG: hypothetical protein SGJ18_13110 [Pseudomonadota bacterium]|nr:hypothetical protein [Pseudomonadota bacterium]
MKLKVLGLLLLSTVSLAAEVKSASVIGKNIQVEVVYGGGCGEHTFDLKLNPACLESFPVQCSAQLYHDSNGDVCEGLVHKSLIFSMKKMGLVDSYFSRASLTITGDNNSRATVTLPDFN